MTVPAHVAAIIVGRAGTPQDKECLIGGMLPDERVLSLARDELFAPFSALRQRRRLGASAIAHPRNTDGSWQCGNSPPVRWASLPAPVLTDRERITWLMVSAACGLAARHSWLADSGPPTAESRIHIGRCTRCQGKAGEATVLVTCSWSGLVLSREYIL